MSRGSGEVPVLIDARPWLGTYFARESGFLAGLAIEQPSSTRRNGQCLIVLRRAAVQSARRAKCQAACAAARKAVHVDYEREEDVADW